MCLGAQNKVCAFGIFSLLIIFCKNVSNETGFYKANQLDKSTGDSWCVNPENGVEVYQTRTKRGEKQKTCGRKFSFCTMLIKITYTLLHGYLIYYSMSHSIGNHVDSSKTPGGICAEM